MQTTVLGSGSRGNSVLVQTGRVRVLVDCGFNFKETRARLGAAGISDERVDAVLLTHEHHDHVQGAAACSNGFAAPVYATAGTREASAKALASCSRHEAFDADRSFEIGDLTVEPVRKLHDAADPVGFLLHHEGRTLGVFTDLGSVDAVVGEALGRCDLLMIEANHDPARLRAGPYPASLKARVGGDVGHLSNEQSARAVAKYGSARLRRVVACHLSETNNAPEDVRRAFVTHMGPMGAVERRFSFQSNPTPLFDV